MQVPGAAAMQVANLVRPEVDTCCVLSLMSSAGMFSAAKVFCNEIPHRLVARHVSV